MNIVGASQYFVLLDDEGMNEPTACEMGGFTVLKCFGPIGWLMTWTHCDGYLPSFNQPRDPVSHVEQS